MELLASRLEGEVVDGLLLVPVGVHAVERLSHLLVVAHLQVGGMVVVVVVVVFYVVSIMIIIINRQPSIASRQSADGKARRATAMLLLTEIHYLLLRLV